ncbi:hypothetical protein [Paenibacillus sp. J22TS3]|uniref:hypothetical protein n=1 Tax=Paenibacillus sp. J22TS3 TaxID=2807192 RepID=UPI001B10CEF4|nr:hypothetical protein [Paenibacillus sp. J22TS3]GIP19921.1 hypothetical protein J22TS3_01960 [Paenibacillus sp. J22TS3]
MELKSWLIWIVAISAAGFGIVVTVIQLLGLSKKKRQSPFTVVESPNASAWARSFKLWMLSLYVFSMKVPLLRTYLSRVRKRIAAINLYDEFKLRFHTMAAGTAAILIFGLSIGVLFSLNPDWLYLLTLLLTVIVLNNVFVDSYINRIEKKLLQQMANYLTEVRHAYHRHGIVEEALTEAAEESEEEIARHGYAIADALVSPKPEEELDKYYLTCPSRFLKSFAGISYLIMEYGDRVKKEGSIYLKAISSLSQEIHLDMLRRTKLDYLLRGLHVIALVPVFFTKPIEVWARSSFPLMEDYYLGKYGLMTKLAIYVLIIVSYVFLQKLSSLDEKSNRSEGTRTGWEQRIYEMRGINGLWKALIPGRRSSGYERVKRLIADTGHRLTPEWFYVRRVLLFAGGFLAAFLLSMFLHSTEKHRILSEPPKSSVVFGAISQEEALNNSRITEQDRVWIEHFGNMNDRNERYQMISRMVASSESAKALTKDEITATVNRLMDKMERLRDEYLKWWELLLALGIGYLGYCLPLWLLYFQRRVRAMEMRHEVYQFQTMITILREMDRISVEEILEWMCSYAAVFKNPIEKCLLHYDSGAESSLLEMKEEAGFPEFQRLTDKLLLAVEKIPISRAFDDLEGEMSYRFEQRRLDYDKMLDSKAGLGRMIGFIPMYSLIFMYLVIPLIWMSFTQMSQYYEQIQKL